MEIYRVFDWDGITVNKRIIGGPLYIPGHRQGKGRHDIPDSDGVFYCSLVKISAIAEALHPFINLTIKNKVFHLESGLTQSLVKISIDNLGLIDLTDAKELLRLSISPQDVATLDRRITQEISRKIFKMGVDGFKWYSAIESKWTNLTLFASRIEDKVSVKKEDIQKLNIDLIEVQEACMFLGINF